MSVDRKKLRIYRLQKGLTLEEASKLLGISRQTLQKYEQDTLTIPLTVFIKMVKLYGLDSVSLYGVKDISFTDFEFDISPYYLVKLYAYQQIEAEIKNEQLFSVSESNAEYFSIRFKNLVKEYIYAVTSKQPELAEEFENEFSKDTDFRIE